MSEEYNIDFVVLWVDGSDKKWKEEISGYAGENQLPLRQEYYRDYDMLRYWFRGIEKNAPWVNKVYFVTNGQKPEWLDESCEKIKLIRHSDIMPADCLPTFSSSAIELYIKNIPGLSEHFVYFNDDCFITDKVTKDYFFKNGLPKDMLAFQPVVCNPEHEAMTYLLINNSLALSRHFNKRENVKKQPGKYFHIGYPPKYFFYNLLELFFPKYTGFYTVHAPSPFLKSMHEKVWEEEREAIERTGHSKFRSVTDVSQYLFREWTKLEGKFVPVNAHRGYRYVETKEDTDKICRYIEKRKQKVLVINDSVVEGDFESVMGPIRDSFQKVFPEKSCFEK